ncbi:MAG: hypothetical protein V3V05_11165 [Pontiella sp.]
MSRYHRVLSLILLISLPLAAVSMERTALLPSDAQTYVRVSNAVSFWDKLKKSSIGRLWADQQFQDFIGNPEAAIWQELFFQGETEAEDKIFLEQMKMLDGEIILAFDLENEEPYIIATMTKEDFDRGLELDDKMRDVVKDPFEINKSTFQDVEIIQHIENVGTPEQQSSWQTHVGNTFVLGYTPEWVEQCIVRLKKNEITEPKGNPVLTFNIPLAQMINAALEEDGAGPSERAVMAALGILDIEVFSSTIEFKDDEMVADNILKISDLGKGLFTLLDVEPSELPTVTFIPSTIASLEVGRFNLMRFWQEIPIFLSVAQPEMKPQFDMILAMIQQQAGISLEQDLLVHLGTKYVAFSVVEGEQQSSIVAIDLQDSMAFKKGLETALASPAMQPYVATGLEISDFLDHTIYTLKESDPNNTMGIAVAGDYLLYGDPAGLRQVIRSETSEAAENQSFERSELVKGLRQHISPRAFAYSAVDWKKNMDVIIRELSKPEYIALIQQKWATSGSPLPPADFTKLPPADHIASFFNVTYQYIEAKGNGLHQKVILKY